MLSTIFKRGNLFELNITLNLQIDEKREKLPGVNAYYLVQPTQDNFDKIVKDFKNNLYDKVFLYFTNVVNNEQLKRLANQIQGLNGLGKIQIVYENYFQFVSLHDNLFISNIDNVYQEFQLYKKQNRNIDETINNISLSLYSVLKTLKSKPICFYQGETNQRILNVLKTQFDNIENQQDDNLSISSDDEQKQVGLILIERDIDLNPCLIHPFGYSQMIHDMYGIRFNRLKVENKLHDLDAQSDIFWRNHICKSIPDAMNNHEEDVLNYKKELDSIKKNDATDDMLNIMENLPKNTEWKLRIDIHSSIIDNFIKVGLTNRLFNKLIDVEQDIIYKNSLSKENKKSLQEFLEKVVEKEYELDRQTDLLRLILIHLINGVQSQNIESIENFKITDKRLLSILEYFQGKYKKSESQETQQQDNYQTMLFSNFKNITQKLQSHGKGLVSKITGSQDKDLIPKIVENIISKNTLSEELKSLGFNSINFNKQLSKFYILQEQKLSSTIIVYCPEGLTYREFISIQEISQKLNKTIICGGSEILNCNNFFNQIQQII